MRGPQSAIRNRGRSPNDTRASYGKAVSVSPTLVTFLTMARVQRKEEILKSELPPTLPLMALRSTIVYPLGTIAVQMGAPENLALLRSHDEPGLIVALVVA